MSSKYTPPIEISIDKLYLDSDNPRIPYEKRTQRTND
jgi:hypothetical protein